MNMDRRAILPALLVPATAAAQVLQQPPIAPPATVIGDIRHT
jgi:hypothetical protein